MSETAEIYDALKRLQTSNTIKLRDLLQNEYSAEWTSKNINLKSLSKTIARKLEILIEMNLVSKEKEGKENIYTIINNFPVQSRAPEIMDQLKDIFQQNKTLYAQAQKPIEELMNELKSPYYIRQNVEDISEKENIIAQLENAINLSRYIDITYSKDINTTKNYLAQALKIAEFEGIWYLLLYLDIDKTYRKFRLSNIDNIKVLHDTFNISKVHDLKLSQWHNVWHDPNKTPSNVTLWISDSKVKYFKQKNIFGLKDNVNKSKKCKDGIEYTLKITHELEILSEIMYWQPHVIILEEDGDLNIIKKIQIILSDMMSRQSQV